ncbi:MAG TPA: DUF4199 domain-containing protein [Flavobacterium sp.]|uniref:DUF4199 domain-containing protein n=1 Tax=Flavobacterium sp. TaxID=239 RepID=UPI002CA2D8D4|nr:DUF4199 domain-containing protein [Flavobacterium sp.]HNP32698.1 DUF4199 domain-containing protein [Flavobacterium sp.]
MKNYSIEIKWALRFTLLTLAWAIGEKLIGLHDKYIADYLLYSMLFAVPAFLFYYLAIAEKKKFAYNGSMTFKQGFVTGIILSAIIALLSPMAQYVIYKSITPHFFENLISYKTTHTSMSAKTAGELFNLKSYMIQSIFNALSYGMVTGALVSLLLKNKK